MNTLGILNLMSHIINEEPDTSDYAITKYLLLNLKTLEQVSINDIVDHVHVSRSSVRRYAVRLGYDNFSDFKRSFSDIAFPSNIHLRDYYRFDDYKQILDEQLVQMKSDISALVSKEVIHSFCQKIREAAHVYIVCPNNTASTMDKFQQELLYAHKLIEVVSSKFESGFHFRSTNGDDDLFIVISVSGVFSESIQEQISILKGRKILLTANRNEGFSEQYDEILYLSSRDIKEDKLGLIGKYGVTYFFDLVSQNYIYQTFLQDEATT